MLRLALQPYVLHFRKPAATSRGALTERPILLLRAWDTARPGVIGWGECGPIPNLSRDDRGDFAEVAGEVCGVINAGYLPGPGDLAQLPSFAFALDMAHRDLLGGGRQFLWDTPFSRGQASLPTHGLIWMDTSAGLLDQVEAKVQAGFAVIKMKVGALPFDEELALLAEIRRRYPPGTIELRLDANGVFAPTEAADKIAALAQFDIAMLEQPIGPGQWDALAALCRRTPIPIALDEELVPVADAVTRRDLLDAVRPQQLVLKPALLGGFGEAEAWIADAEARGVQWWINSLLESNLGLNAISQWASFCGGGRIHGLGTGGLFTNNFGGPVQLEGNVLRRVADVEWRLPIGVEA